MAASVWQEFEADGETVVRRKLIEGDYDPVESKRRMALEWLGLNARDRTEIREASMLEATKQAASSASKAARWAMWAAVGAIIPALLIFKDQLRAMLSP